MPFIAINVESSLQVMQVIQQEMQTYIASSDRPAYDGIVDIKQMISSNIIWKIEDIIDLGVLGSGEHMRLLLDLQDMANSLSSLEQEQEGVWIRNWQWGVVQVARVMIGKFKEEASAVLGENNALIVEIQHNMDRDEDFLSNKDVEQMV